jgi:6-phospho-beta-glucosidase
LTINPLVANDKVAIAIVDEMLEAHKEYLPRFLKK